MTFDPGAMEGFVKEHPLGVALGALGIVLVIWWAVASNSSSSAASAPATSASSTGDAGITAAAGIQSAQIAAGVANNAAAIAGTTAQSSAYYNAATEIANTNLGYVQTAYASQVLEQSSQNNTISSEFSALAATLASFGSDLQSQTVGPSSSQTTSTQIASGGTGVANTSTGTTTSSTSGGSSSTLSSGGLSALSSMISTLGNSFTQAINKSTVYASGIVGPQFNAMIAANYLPLSGGPGVGPAASATTSGSASQSYPSGTTGAAA